ncbi:hypothetical protein Q5P01_000064 [Channa striata]|uniref:Uncharacterized protein n=1 Tax=Channa striata TaxID=64152 RepID=A0AA88IDS8_CHASR|nr:hypothetical protein Q5P01_000064 [Channa striata]
MGDSGGEGEQEHPHRVRLSHRDERRAVHVRRRGLHGAAVQALIQGEHRLHNMECAIAVFNIVIAICVVTMVLRPPCSGETRRGRGQRKGATEIAIAPNSSRDNRFYYSSRGSGNPYYSQSSGFMVASIGGHLEVHDTVGHCQHGKPCAIACPSDKGGRLAVARSGSEGELWWGEEWKGVQIKSGDDKSRRDDRRPPENPSLAGCRKRYPRDRRGSGATGYPPGGVLEVGEEGRMEIARPYPAWSASVQTPVRSTVIPWSWASADGDPVRGLGWGLFGEVFWLASPCREEARVNDRRRGGGRLFGETSVNTTLVEARLGDPLSRRWSWIPLWNLT